MKRPIICGGRYFADKAFVFDKLDELNHEHNFLHVIQGGCRTGADLLAREWAISRNVEYRHYPVTQAQWKEHGRAAGPMRNQRMIDEERPDAVVAFPGGRGTADMKRRGLYQSIPVLEYAP